MTCLFKIMVYRKKNATWNMFCNVQLDFRILKNDIQYSHSFQVELLVVWVYRSENRGSLHSVKQDLWTDCFREIFC